MAMSLEEEALEASKLLKNKTISEVLRHKKSELLIKFTDGTKFFINQTQDGLELSIT